MKMCLAGLLLAAADMFSRLNSLPEGIIMKIAEYLEWSYFNGIRKCNERDPIYTQRCLTKYGYMVRMPLSSLDWYFQGRLGALTSFLLGHDPEIYSVSASNLPWAGCGTLVVLIFTDRELPHKINTLKSTIAYLLEALIPNFLQIHIDVFRQLGTTRCLESGSVDDVYHTVFHIMFIQPFGMATFFQPFLDTAEKSRELMRQLSAEYDILCNKARGAIEFISDTQKSKKKKTLILSK